MSRPVCPKRPEPTAAGRSARARARSLALVLLLALLLAAAPGPLRAQQAGQAQEEALQERREQMQELEREKAQIEQRLERFRASEAETRAEIDQLARQVRASRQRKAELAGRVETVTAEREQQQDRIEHLQAQIEQRRERIGERLRRLYALSKLGATGTLFRMARYETFAKDSHTLALLQAADRRAIAEYQQLNERLRTRKAEAAATLERLDGLRAELEEETAQLAERERFLQASLADLRENRELYQRYLADLEQTMERMQAAVTRLEEQSREQENAAARRSAPPETLRGRLPPPARGRVLAGFGERDPRYELKKFQRGIVLRVAENAPVQAVAGGRAVHAGPFRGYQELVVLDHGRGLFTVYGHLEGLQVEQGQWVDGGARLGNATYQPVDEAYNLYFELRHDGEPRDPLDWLRDGALQGPNGAGG